MPSFADAPVTFVILVVYLAAAAWTGVFDPSIEDLVGHGAAVGLLIPDEPWRLLSSAFLHGGLLHLALNSIGLTWLGPQLERSLGGTRYALLYVITAIAGSIVGVVTQHPLGSLVGGSGALFGMFGAMVAMYTRMGRSHFDFLSYHGPRSIVVMIGANFVLGFMFPQVSNAAHLGGLISGFVLTYMFYDRGRSANDAITRVIQAGWIALFAVSVLYAVQPSLSIEWSIRQAIHGSTLEIREDHERRLRRDGYSLHGLEDEFREELPKLWGETGRLVVHRLFD